jgi:S-adenosylmethionine:tRNA ribosyltransferase-isomerase
MLERIIDQQHFIAHVRTSKRINIGMEIILPDDLVVTVSETLDGLFALQTRTAIDLYAYLEHHGNLPLPPYMQRQAEIADESRYQTVYAAHNGSVAAPTAGLHFTPEILTQIEAKGATVASVTLHVGSGTFKPVSVENISEHKMHSEVFQINKATIELIKQTKARGGKIIAVGTTSLRTLESVAKRGLHAQSGETDIFITPGFKFQLVDKLITNFHLPKSTLLMLVSAFSGKDKIDMAYQHAIKNNYRFFSYGDAMLLTRQD